MPPRTPPGDTSTADFTLKLLGEPSISVAGDGSSPPIFVIGKPLALIAYLACNAGRRASRDQLLNLLWADMEPEGARHALRQTIWFVRKRAGEALISASGDSVTLSTSLPSDRDDFLAAFHAEDWETAVSLYGGDFLPGFAAPGGAELERWADAERLRLRTAYYRSAEHLIRKRLSESRFRDAQLLARRMVDQNRLYEPAWRLLLESLLAGSETASAMLEASTLEELLAREEQEPEPATRSLLRLAKQLPPTGARPAEERALIAELIGREREFSAIMSSWDRARTSRAQHVQLTSPAGLGKTRLLGDVAARLRASRARVVEIGASSGARELPYSLASDLAAALSVLPGAVGISPDSGSALVALNPSLSSTFRTTTDQSTGEEALRRRSIAFRELLTAVSEESAIALLIDDLHWADAPSRRILETTLTSLERQRVLIVTTARSSPEDGLSGPVTERMALSPLSESEVAALVASLASLPSEPWAASFPRDLQASTSGSPLLILETLQYLIDRDVLRRDAEGWQTSDHLALREVLRAGGALQRRLEQLDRHARWLLTLMALWSAPVAGDQLAEAAGRPLAEVEVALGALEKRGFVRRADNEWSIAHDEIAAAATELASSDTLGMGSAAVGRVIARHASTDLRELRRAGPLLGRTNLMTELAPLFTRFVMQSRAAGERASNAERAREFLGAAWTEGRSREIIRRLPLYARVGFFSSRAVAITAFALALVNISVIITPFLTRGRNAGAPDAQLVVTVPADDSLANAYAIPIRTAEWQPAKALELASKTPIIARFSNRHLNYARIPINRTRDWLTSRTVPDSGVIDVYRNSPDGSSRRLTFARGDDMAEAVSPDGGQLIISTARWNALRRYDLAILDLASGRTRQLTHGEESDASGIWSQDGSRIAFRRKTWRLPAFELCVIDIDGQNLSCRTMDSDFTLLVWLDAKRVTLLRPLDADGREELRLVDLESGTSSVLEESVRGEPHFSADGLWYVCQCARIGFDESTWQVIPTRHPSENRPILPPPVGNGGRASFQFAAVPIDYLNVLRVAPVQGVPQAGVPYTFQTVAFNASGAPGTARALRWSVSDSLIATINAATGELLPRREGRVTIIVSAGGWRTATLEVTIAPRAAPLVVFREEWSGAIDRAWYTFGSPAPSVVGQDGRRALLNNGDGSFASGVTTRHGWSGREGLALDADLYANITLPQWQLINIGMYTLDSTRLGSHAGDGENLAEWIIGDGVCEFQYPGGPEGPGAADLLMAGASAEVARAPAPPSFRNKTWFHVRVQVLPDRRCAVAINGQPIFLSSRQAFPDAPLRISTHGNSVSTQMLVGPMTLRTGIPDDVDWTSLSRVRDSLATVRLSRPVTVRPSPR